MSNKPQNPNGLPDLNYLVEATGRDLQSKVAFSGFSGPPQYNDEQEKRPVHDDAALRQMYQQFQNNGNVDDDEDFDDEDDLDEGDYEGEDEFFDGEDEYPTPPSLRQPDGGFLRDEPLFPGGPLMSEINSWKKQYEVEGHTIHLSEDIGGENFIWRTLARTEYRELMNLPNTDPLQREEIICEICVLFPYNYDFQTMAARKAGIPAVLAEQILHESGFRRPSPPQRL